MSLMTRPLSRSPRRRRLVWCCSGAVALSSHSWPTTSKSRSPCVTAAAAAALSTASVNGSRRQSGVIEAAKARVRPSWPPAKWSECGLRSLPPPPPRDDAILRTLDDPSPLPDSARNVDLSRPGRFSHDLRSDWPDVDAFSVDELLDRYGEQELSVGTDDATGDDVTLPLAEYVAYCGRDADGDDCPLYVFDDWVLTEEADCPLGRAYSVPRCFPHDYMDLMGEDERYPHRWLLIGAGRSGTAPHVDPTATAAWNTLVSGRKRWFLFPPQPDASAAGYRTESSRSRLDEYRDEFRENGEGDHAVTTSQDGGAGKDCDSANHWLHHWYRQEADLGEGGGCYDFVQSAGETVYVPDGWRHAVVNLDPVNVAVTHNFVGPHNVRRSIESMKRNDPELAVRWESLLKERGWLV